MIPKKSVAWTAIFLVLAIGHFSFGQDKVIEKKMSREDARRFAGEIKIIVLRTYSDWDRDTDRYYPAVEDVVIRELQKKGYEVIIASSFWAYRVEETHPQYGTLLKLIVDPSKMTRPDVAYLDMFVSFWGFQDYTTHTGWRETARVTNTWGNPIVKVKEPVETKNYYMVGAVKIDSYLFFGKRRYPSNEKYVHIEKKGGYNIQDAVKTVLSGIPRRRK
ncbi:MAG: hypothetical protein JW747_03925 [Candidatus Aminicenantes bacterium]|nr:hypothetical protein [Candidatus Aminicenantes bacterium]